MAGVAEEVGVLLSKLQDALPGFRKPDPTGAKDIVVDIFQQMCMDMTPHEFDLCLSLLMGEKGILDVGRNVSKNQEFGDCKKAILDILKTLINKDAQKINKYADEIRKFCKLLYYTDKLAKIRAAALDTVIELMLLCHASIDVQQLGLSQFVERVCIDIKSNKTSTVLQQQLRILGVLCSCYPQEAAPHASLILKVLKEHLIKQTTAGSNPDLTALAGALQGLCFYLHHFPEGLADEPQFYGQLYPHIHKVLNSELNLPRREAQRAALEIISKHGPKFSEHLYKNYESLFKWLLFWSSSHNRDDHKAGIIAMDTFVEVIANVLQLQAEAKVATGAQVFKYLVQQYNRLLEHGRSTSRVSIAVKGYGLLAGACHLYLSADQVQTMFSQVLSASHYAFFRASEMIEDKLASVPSFIESLAIIMNNMESISPAHIDCVSQLVHGMIENFALVNISRQFLVWRAIYTLLATLLNKPGHLHTFMHRLVYQTIIYSCSHDPLLETTEDYSSNNSAVKDQKWKGLKNEVVTYRNFLPLWRGLLAPSSVQVTGLPQAKVVELGVLLYHEFIECILQISQKLNLETEKKGSDEDSKEVENEAATSDPVSGVTAIVSKDMQVYMNLVFLFTANVPLQCEHHLIGHIPALCHHFIRLSSGQPLVAGHYSMIATTLANAKETPFFKRTENVESATTIDLLTSFTKDLLQRCRQYRDQLLAESLRLVLHLPACIVRKIFPQLVSPLQTALVMGMSYLPLAEVCISALHLWVRFLDEEILHEHLPKVLPLLLPYLRSQESGGEAEVQSRVITVKMSLAHQRRKVDMKKLKDSKKVDKTGMARVQLAILRLIGSLDAQLSLAVIPSDSDAVSEQAVRWDTTKHVVIRVPFSDVKPEMYLDEFLPRIIDLATSSSDRQTKVASCELLHSVVIVMIGCGTLSNAKPMSGLYQHVFPALLRLSCDPDHVTRQLFLPLIFQSIHWFTNNRNFEHPHTAQLLQAIMDGLVSPSEPALRDISGQCLAEFVKWSRKQCRAKEKTSANMKSILKRIFSLCKHPSAFKRLGGCLAWNSIYVQLREDAAVVDVWTIEVLQQLLTCLALAHMDDPALGTHDQAKEALTHVVKILTFRNDVFNKTSADRRIPSGFSAATLEDVLEWLLQQCGRSQTEARRCSMEMLGRLAPHTKGYRSSKEFVEKYCMSHERQWLCVVDILEEDHSGNGVSGFSPESWTGKEQMFKSVFSFLENLLAALDGYTWIIGESIAAAADTLGTQDSKLFLCIEFFLEEMMTHSVPEFFRRCNAGRGIPYTPQEEEDMGKVKCAVFVRVLDVVTLLMEHGSANLIKESLHATLWKMVALAVLDPMVLDFNLKDTEVVQQLPLRLKETLTIAIKTLPAHVQSLLVKILEEQLLLPKYNMQQLLPTSFTRDMYVDVRTKHIFRGVEVLLQTGWLAKSKVLEQMVNENLVTWSCKSIISSDGRSAVALQPTQRDFVCHVLQLGLQLGDKVVPYILEQVTSREVLRGPLGEDLNRGSHLLNQLEFVLMPILLDNVEKCVLWCVEAVQSNNFIHGMTFMATLLRAMVSKADLRKRYGEKAVCELQSHWSSFAWQSGGGTQEALLNILSLMFLVDSKRHLQTTCLSDSPVVIFFCSVLSSPSLEFRCKIQALKLLPFYCTMAQDVIDKTMKALSSYAENHFPLKSSEFPKGSSRDHEYHSALAEVMTALHLTGSFDLLKFLVGIICREEEHRYEQDFQETLIKYIQHMTRPKKEEALNNIFIFFKDSDRELPSIRLNTVERVLVPMLQSMSSLVVSKFFEKWICTIMSGVSLSIAGRDTEQHKDLVTKTASFLLLQILYCKLSKEQVFSSASTVNAAFRPQDQTGKEMTKEVFKQGSKVAKGELRHNQTQADLRRKCACAAYNSMIAVLSCVQNELKFYTAFLFTENPVKGEALWESLIDCNKAHNFDIEVSTNTSRKKKFVAVRESLKEQSKRFGLEHSRTVQYFSSHYLSDSSLREDLSQYDFSSSVVLAMTPKDDQESLDPEDIGGSFMSSDFDQNDYNDHDVMPNLTAVIHYMKTSGILPEWKSESLPGSADVPAFMKNIKIKLEDRTTPPNVKLFLLRLMTNTASVFAPYGQHFVAPILSCMTDSTLGDNINYFLSDILIMLLEWGPQAVPDNSILASRVLKRLSINAPHTRMDVFKYNLEITRTVIETWKSVVEVPYDVIYSLMEVREGKSREVEAGLQLLGAVLLNSLPPFPPENGILKKRCEGAILRLLGERSVSLYGPAAEVAGLILKFEVDKQGDDEAVSGGFADQVVQKLLDQTRHQHNQAITSIYNVHKHCPTIVQRFINKLLMLLPTLYGKYQTDVLRCLVSYASSLEDVYAHLKEQNLLQILGRKEPSTQLVSLELVDAVMSKLTPKQLQEFLPGIVAFVGHPTPKCRELMYQILFKVYNKYSCEIEGEGLHIAQESRITLLRGTTDKDAALRQTVLNHWTNGAPGTLPERLLHILRDLYSADSEDTFLHLATYVLMEATHSSPDYNLPMFQKSLTDCKFREFKVSGSWQARHASMMPLFIETQQAESSGMATLTSLMSMTQGEDMDVVDGGGHRYVEETQANVFPATQQQAGGAYNWVTGSTFDTTVADMEYEATHTSGQSTTGQLLFSVGAQGGGGSKSRPVGLGRSKLRPVDQPDNANNSEDAVKAKLLRRRFTRNQDREKEHIYFAKMEERRRKLRDKLDEERKLRREAQVTMYRKYRIGELPDIQIPYQAVIAPLQVLAQHDTNIAKLLMTKVCQGLVDNLDTLMARSQVQEWKEQLADRIRNILSSSYQYHPQLIGALLHIILENNIYIDPENISEACIASQTEALGVLALEQQLLQDEEYPVNVRKRLKMDKSSILPRATVAWINMAELYKSVGMWDAVTGIVDQTVGQHQETKEALQYESISQHKGAFDLYRKALQTTDWENPPSSAEERVWVEWYCACAGTLGQWAELEKYIEKQFLVDESTGSLNLDQVWDLPRPAPILTSLVHSKLMNILEGSSSDGGLCKFVDSSLQCPRKATLLESNFSVQLAVLALYQEKAEWAKTLLDKAVQTCLSSLSQYTCLTPKPLVASLRSVQLLMELQDYLYMNKKGEAWQCRGILEQWKKHQPHQEDPPLFVQCIASYRTLYLDLLTKKLKDEDKQLSELADRVRLQILMDVVHTALDQSNYLMAFRYLKRIHSKVQQQSEDHAKFYLLMTRGNIVKNQQTPCSGIKYLVEAWAKCLGKVSGMEVMNKPHIEMEYLQLESTICKEICCVLRHVPVSDIEDTYLNALHNKFEHVQKEDTTSWVKNLLACSLSCLVQAVNLAMPGQEAAVSSTVYEKQYKNQVALANFCEEVLADNSWKESIDVQTYQQHLVSSVLSAMAQGSQEAHHRFPRLLNLLDENQGLTETFVAEVDRVPVWMFVLWISHILIYFDKGPGPALHSIVVELAKVYPQALVYPFNVSQQQYKFATASGKVARAVCKKVSGILAENRLVNDFIDAMSLLVVPFVAVKDACAALIGGKDQKKLVEGVKQIEEEFVKLSIRKGSVMEKGSLYERASAKYKVSFYNHFGEGLKKIGSMSVNVIKKKLGEWRNEIDQSKSLPGNLKELSPWLANFQAANFVEEMEVPGQYSGYTKPLPEYHVKLVGFGERLVVMRSLRYPMQLRLRGDDEKEHRFLVKWGEDLRTDQRFEQIFSMMNNLFRSSVLCAQGSSLGPRLETFKVIPLSLKVGLLEWVESTIPLRELILSKEESNGKYNTARKIYWGAENWPPNKQVKKEDVVRTYERCIHEMQWDALKKSLLAIASGSEGFFYLRSAFLSSHATLCASHWMLGIGDRHLSNFLVSTKTGRVIGIDFGHHFESATQFLPFPELMPFRLTPQIVNIMKPLGTAGILRETMVRVIGTIRENHFALEAAIEAFVKEPTEDWLGWVRRQAGETTDKQIDLFSQKRLQMLQYKLQGASAWYITEQALALSCHPDIRKFLPSLRKALAGELGVNLRSGLSKTQLTVHQQVDALIDLATDPNILGRTYGGWDPFV